MGFDKATLLIDGMPLWKRQLATLRQTGASELLISGKLDGPYASSGIPVVLDAAPNLGPLAGIAKILEAATHPFVLVLAVDLPKMTPEWLSELVRAGPAIPMRGEMLEPLAAVYPKNAQPIAAALLSRGELAMRSFARELLHGGSAKPYPVSPGDFGLFANVNTPEDAQNLRRKPE